MNGVPHMVLGGGALAAGYWLCRRQLAFQATARVPTGVVTEILKMKRQDSTHRGGAPSTYFAPVVEFRADSGAMVTYRCSEYISPNPYTVGMRLEVRYDPANPARAQLTNPVLAWLWPAGISIIGAVFVLVGAFVSFGGWE
jgi:hypothetical protein